MCTLLFIAYKLLCISAADESSGMRITAVTLYDNGYAVFEREAFVHGDGHIDLYFPSHLITHVLESLQFTGDAAPHVGNIAYQATKPTATIKFNTSSGPMIGLINHLLGSLATFDFKSRSEPVQGRILGVERDMILDEKSVPVPHVSMYLAGGRLAAYPLSDIIAVHLDEDGTKRDISFSLDLAKNKSGDDMQKLSVFYSGIEGCKQLVARYGFKVKEWKSSYRMTCSSDDPEKFLLHGLAIVENSLWEDWDNVKLTLVVGAPAIHTEAETKDQGIWSLVIKDLSGSTFSVRANPKDSVLAIKEKIAKKSHISASSFKLVFSGKPVEDGRQLSDYTINNGATLHMSKIESREGMHASSSSHQTQFVMAAQNNLSFYPIPMRVTAQRKQKAIVSMLQTELVGQQVLLYDETIRKGNPLCSILFENTTGRTLEGGMMNVSTTTHFLGESSLPTLTPGDESPPIPYCVELDCEVIKEMDATFRQPHRIEIYEGSISTFRIHQERTVYRIVNKSENKLDFLLNHLFLEDYDLIQNPDNEEEEPVDITDRFYQFRFAVQPKDEKKTFVVREQITDRQKSLVRNLEMEVFKKWKSRQYFDAVTETAINKVFSLKAEIASLDTDVYLHESEVREINSTQDHIRENISALEHHSKQASKYIAALEEAEEKLKKAQASVKSAKSKKKELEKTLRSTINDIQYTKDLVVPLPPTDK